MVVGFPADVAWPPDAPPAFAASHDSAVDDIFAALAFLQSHSVAGVHAVAGTPIIAFTYSAILVFHWFSHLCCCWGSLMF